MSSLVKLVPVDRLKYLTKINSVTIDDLVFRLHYRFTFISLLIVSLLLIVGQIFGKPIECINGSHGDVPQRLLEKYCLVEGTFTLTKAYDKDVFKDIIAPGVDKYNANDEVLKHSYYQWVCVVLFLQSLCFYVTRMLWKGWERGQIKQLINDLNKVILKPSEKQEDIDLLVGYLVRRRNTYTGYSFRYFLCEVINFFNAITQMVFINWFLGGEFSRYGVNVLQYIYRDPNQSVDPMTRVFPKLTKCSFRKFGPSGLVQEFSNLCLLPQNNLNEKVYIILWFWLYILVVASGLMVIYRLIIIAFPQIRYFLLHRLHRLVPPKYFDVILAKCNYGDWFVLYLLGENMDTIHYKDFIIQLSEQFDELPAGRFQDEIESQETTKPPKVNTIDVSLNDK